MGIFHFVDGIGNLLELVEGGGAECLPPAEVCFATLERGERMPGKKNLVGVGRPHKKVVGCAMQQGAELVDVAKPEAGAVTIEQVVSRVARETGVDKVGEGLLNVAEGEHGADVEDKHGRIRIKMVSG